MVLSRFSCSPLRRSLQRKQASVSPNMGQQSNRKLVQSHVQTDIHVTVYESKAGSIIDENERVPGPGECDPTEGVRQVEGKTTR